MFMLYGEWLHQLLYNLVTFNFTILMWIEFVGYSNNYLVSCFIAMGNPINFLAVFIPQENAKFLLELAIPITLYLTCVSFIPLYNYKGLIASLC